MTSKQIQRCEASHIHRGCELKMRDGSWAKVKDCYPHTHFRVNVLLTDRPSVLIDEDAVVEIRTDN